MNLHNLMCCGIKEIQGLRDWNERSFYHLVRQYVGMFPCAWVCFNGVQTGGYVESFRQFIRRENLGPIIDLPQVVNPNSSNLLDVGMWQVNREAMIAWYGRKQIEYHHICPCQVCDNQRRAQLRSQEMATNLRRRTVGQVLRDAARDISGRQVANHQAQLEAQQQEHLNYVVQNYLGEPAPVLPPAAPPYPPGEPPAGVDEAPF